MMFTMRSAALAMAMAAHFGSQAQALPEPLLQAARKAVLTNPDVQVRWNGFKAAHNEQDAMSSGRLPSIELNSRAGRESRSTPQTDYGSYNLGANQLTLNQLLFDGMWTSNETKRLGYAKLARYYELAEASEASALAAVLAYADVARYRELVQAGTENYAEHKLAAQQLEERSKGGVGRGADTEQANGRLALAEASLVTELANLQNASTRYLRVVGEKPPDSLPPLPDPFKLGEMPATVDLLMGQGFQGNPALNAALENSRAYKTAVDSRKAFFLPRLDGRLYQNRERNTDGVLGDTRVAGIELLLNANLYRGGADKARQNQALDQSKQVRDLQEKVCREVRQALSVAYSDTRSLAEQQQHQSQHRLSTEKAREAYRQQFVIGQRTLLDLLDTQKEYYEANRAYINARYSQIGAQARTLSAMGKLVPVLGADRPDMPVAKDAGQEHDGIDTSELCPVAETEVDTVAAIKARLEKPTGPKSYVVLIPSPDGSIGRVTVEGSKGQKVLTQSGEVALLDGSRVTTEVSKTQLNSDFGAAIAARPPIPEVFVLYFNRGSTQITKESKALLGTMIARIKARQALDIWLIGHTDTVGPTKNNDALGLKRAKAMAKLLQQKGRKDLTMTVESYGERSPQIATPDETDEPRNRRGEVTFR
ncbi:MAG: TolC family outer membrane protein [Comamonadaceae bacterium]|nr:TolC family outer membrane protein [Comamonadaceae bacterium]